MSGGRLFQSRLPAAVKARSPIFIIYQFLSPVYHRPKYKKIVGLLSLPKIRATQENTKKQLVRKKMNA